MRIGIDCRNILHPSAGESAGVGHYVHHLVAALLQEDRTNEYVLFFDNHDVAQAKREIIRGNPRVTVRVLPFRTFRKVLPFIYRHIVVASIFEREKLDLLHGPANVVPMFYRRPWIVTVHDLAIYDHPEWFPAGSLGTQRFSTSVLVPHAIEHAKRVIAVSKATAADISRLFKVKADHIDVVPEGVEKPQSSKDADAVLADFGVQKGHYFLFVGTVEPRKNIPTAIRGFMRATKSGLIAADAKFLIAGARGWRNADVFAALREAHGLLGRNQVEYVGYLSADEKAVLMANARAFVFPSHFEGFGLPVLEAMSLGTPVIASDAAALVETSGGAALHVPAHDFYGFAEAFGNVWNDPQLGDRLREAGLARCKDFTWAHTARATMRAYELTRANPVETSGHGVA